MKAKKSIEHLRLEEENRELRKQLAAYERLLDKEGAIVEPKSEEGLDDPFHVLFETISDGLLITRASDGSIMDLNEGFVRLMGYTKEELIGRKTMELSVWNDPEDRDRLRTDLSCRGRVDDFVTRLRRQDGRTITVLIRAAYVEIENEKYILGINKDIDEWSEVSRDLDRSRARYEDLVELLPAVLFECDSDLNFTFMNAAGLEVTGESMAVTRKIPLTRVVKPVAEVDLAGWARGATKNSLHPRLEVDVLSKEGRSYRALLTISSLPENSERKGYLGVLVDLTDQMKTRERLAKLSQAVEQSPSLVLITDKAGHIEYFNPSFARVTGFTLEEAIGRTPRILKSGFVAESTYRTMWTSILAGEEWRKDFLNRKKNGETFWQRTVISPIHDERGNLTHFLQVAEDITREKELESELFQAQKMEAIGHLAGGIAHDFNNMLTVIMGAGEILQGHLDQEEQKGLMESILSAARRSASLTHQLLVFSKKQVLHPELIDLNLVIRDAEKLFDRIVGDNIRVETELQENVGLSLLDQTQVHQILLNLVVNAKEAIVGSGTVSIATSRVEIRQELLANTGKVEAGSYVALTVADTGRGMDEETIAHMFEPFYTTKSTGTGLGLATVYGIVQQSEGQIDLKSALGEGTTFTIYFPISSQESCGGDLIQTVHDGHGGSETIFVIEDEDAVRQFVSKVLTEHGYSVHLADSAESAKTMWGEIVEQTNLVLTDVVLPQEDGVHLCRALRESNPELPVVFMSGYTEESAAHRLEVCKGRTLLPKPFGADQLAAMVRQVLERARTRE